MIQKEKNGSFLLELVVYVMIVALFIRIFFPFIVRIQRDMQNQVDDIRQRMHGYSAFNLLSRDIRMAPANKKYWYCLEKNYMVWQQDREAMGWYLKNGKLSRVKGIYDKRSNRWHHVSWATVVPHVSGGSFSYQCDDLGDLHNIGCMFEYQTKPNLTKTMSRTFFLKNRTIKF